jgi:predicted RNA methylase
MSVGKELIQKYHLNADEQETLSDLWYHDFACFGIKTVQEPGIWKKNQACKEGPLFSMIEEAVKSVKQRSESVKGVELFCADGFYGLYAVQKGAEHVHGMDLDEKNLKKATLIAKMLGYAKKTNFEKRDVYTLSGSYDLGICAGGLYHISDPAALLKLLKAHVHGPLVIQTVYSLAKTSPDYFETPAPGWTWGCRFSYDHLKKMIRDAGWKIIREEKNELLGNTRPEDRGSAYFLCAP